MAQHTNKQTSRVKTALTVTTLVITAALLVASVTLNVKLWKDETTVSEKLTQQESKYAELELAKKNVDTENAANLAALEQTKKLETTADLLGKNDPDYPYAAQFPDLYVDPAPITAETEKTVYLSFDDGPSKLTPGILDTLKANGAVGTFFVTAQSFNADTVKRAVAEGNVIGIHTYTHVYEDIYASVPAYLEDFNNMFQKVVEATGVKPQTFRFPGGSVNNYNRSIYQSIIAEMTRRGFTYHDWNVDSGDASAHPSVDVILSNVNKSLGYTSPVVLMHDAAPKQYTADALAKVIQAYKTAGYTFGTLDHRKSCFFPYRTDLS